MYKVKKGDKVIVTRGKDKGKTGEVLKTVNKVNGRMVVVKGVNVVKKNQKPNPTIGVTGGIIQFEKPIDISNVMLIDEKSNKPSRAMFEFDKSGKKVRKLVKSK